MEKREIRRLLVKGDTHGMIHVWIRMVDGWLNEGDAILVAGDFGFIFEENPDKERFLDELTGRPYTVLFIDGNHDNHPKLASYPEEIWHGGRIHRIRENVIHLMRGQVYEINQRTLFTMGGGFSIDRARRTEGYDWWPQEMPSEEEKNEADRNLEKAGFRVDYIVTHEPPEDTMTRFHPWHPDEVSLTFYLEGIRSRVSYRKWYFGHLHRDEELWRNQYVLYHGIRDMETGEMINESELRSYGWSPKTPSTGVIGACGPMTFANTVEER